MQESLSIIVLREFYISKDYSTEGDRGCLVYI